MNEGGDGQRPTETDMQTAPTAKELVGHYNQGRNLPLALKTVALFLGKSPDIVQTELEEAGVRPLTRGEYKQVLINHRIAALRRKGEYSDEPETRVIRTVVEEDGQKVIRGKPVERPKWDMTLLTVDIGGTSGHWIYTPSDTIIDDKLKALLMEDEIARIGEEVGDPPAPIDENKPTEFYGAIQSPDTILEGPPTDDPNYNRIKEFLKQRRRNLREALRNRR